MAQKNLLNKTRCYLVGHMQYEDGRKWREYAESELKKLNIIAYNPYKKPFVKDVKEDEKARLATEKQMLDGKYDLVARRMRKIRSYDLNLVDRSDFIIAHLYPEIASWGSAEEIVTACRMKKPVFVSIDGGKKRTPQWLLGMFPHKYIYSNPKQIISMIKKLNDGSRKMDSDRWRLLIEELR